MRLERFNEIDNEIKVMLCEKERQEKMFGKDTGSSAKIRNLENERTELLEELKSMCKGNEYFILYNVYVNKMTHKEVAALFTPPMSEKTIAITVCKFKKNNKTK